MKNEWSPFDGDGGSNYYLNVETKDVTSNDRDWLQSWANLTNSVNRVLQHINYGNDISELFLKDSINKKFVRFYDDITDECGPEDKQHAWAILEKPEEVIMYGPYYPNYNKGLHSEDIVIKQTEELLVSDHVSENWHLYIFTMNSPCLSRNIGPCMLSLIQKAFEWYTQYGVRTYIGYKKCWGFRGNKEILYRDINYTQFKLISGSHKYDNYLNRIKKIPRDLLVPLCEIQFMAIKRWLNQGQMDFKFPLDYATPEPGRKTNLKNMYIISASGLEDEREHLTQEIINMLDSVHPSFVDKIQGLEEYLEKGNAFARDYTFDTEMPDIICTKLRMSFEQCWKDMVQDKYAELLRERFIEDFNRGVVQLFIKDVTALTKDYIEIGQVKFPDNN